MLEQVVKIEEEIIGWRRDLHQIPELGLELPQTSAYIQNRLKEMGIDYHTLIDGNAVVGLIKGDQKGKTLAIRADMDGLPIKEETDFAFKSRNENMHACGHDGHVAMLLGAAKILHQNRNLLKGNVKLIFQPGEEYPGGAEPMIKEGVLDNPAVDAVIGLHEGVINPAVPKGMIGISYGETMACMDRFKVTVQGKGAHGAYPEQSIDPISVAVEIISGLYRIKAREINANDPAVLSICQIHGGFNQNIIPDTVFFEGTVRATDQKVREYIATRLEEISVGIARSMGASAKVTYDYKYPPLVNHLELTKRFTDSAKKIVPLDKIVTLEKPIMGGEDFAFFSQKVPGTFFFLSNGLEFDGKIHPHHTSKFAVDESFFKLGTGLFVQFAFDYLS